MMWLWEEGGGRGTVGGKRVDGRKVVRWEEQT